MSLYRTYRPQSFTDVVGQDAIITTLENAASQGKLAHAFLFAGSRGTGKTSVARILAKTLMTQGIEDDAIKKQIIDGIEDGSLVDLLEIDAASNRGIDDVRDLIEKIQFSPVVASAKVYIIDEVHMLTKEAFNALLKTLEEPPSYAYFILATTEIHKIPATIQSRYQCFPFRTISEENIVQRLQFIADQEKITIDRDALRAIAHHVEGGMRDAISLLDQLRSLESVSISDVEARFGGLSTEHTEAIMQALTDKDPQKIIDTVRSVEDAGISLDVLLRKLLGIVRTSLHQAVAEKKSTVSLEKMLRTLLNAIRDLKSAPVQGLVLEAALLSLCESSEGENAEIVMPKKEAEEAKESEEAEEIKTEPTPQPEPETEPEPKPATIQAPENNLPSLKVIWNEIVEKVTPPSTRMSLKNARLISLEGDKLTLGFNSDFHKEKVAAPESARGIEEAIEEVFKRTLSIECVVSEKEEIIDTEEINIAEAASEIF